MKKSKGIVVLLLTAIITVFLCYTAGIGLGPTGTGSAKNIKTGLDLSGGVSITYQAKDSNPSAEDMSDTVYKLQKRVEQYSTEAQVYKEGSDRIAVEIPGVTDADAILNDLGKPGSLCFITMTDDDGNANFSSTGSGYVLARSLDEIRESGSVVLEGTDVKDAQGGAFQSDKNSSREYAVSLTLTDEGKTKFADATEANVGKQIAIVYDNQILSAPKVNEAITGGQAQITGMSSVEEAQNLASYIRIGSLSIELEELRSSVVAAQLGEEAISTSVMAGLIGLVIVIIFMIIMYRLPGVVAGVALILYTAIVLITLNAFDITLTLPGIAGIILGIGMAVDGNVIIYTRIREEIGAGKSVENAILSGYNKATSSIVDGNVTTLIAALVLYIFGTGPVKGFATTLAVGNIVSIFTSLVITKVIMKLLYNFGIRDAKWYGKNVYRKTLNVLSIKKWAAIGSAVVIAAGIITMAVQAGLGNRALNFSLEFVGGSTTTFTFDKEYTAEEIEDNIIPIIRDAAGITEVQQQKVADSTQVSFKTSDLSLEQREAIENAVTAKYPIKDGTIVETDTISSSVSATVKRDAILSVILATICMLIYIFVRFRDIRFALAAVLALLHDVLVVIAFYAFARIPVGTTFIACMLTIVGYSINGTIIIFDRIREQLKTANSKTNITELVNSSITSTMSRTVYTSITTLIMLIVLFIMGVTSVKEFTLPLIVGIVVGAYSSVCLTSAMWYVMGGKKRGVVEENNKKAASKKEVFEDGSQV
jgi:SecD/SecF fusion protein